MSDRGGKILHLDRRPATHADVERMFDVSARALKTHVETNFGRWDSAEQREMFFRSTIPGAHEMLFAGDTLLGFLWVARSSQEIYLHRIAIAPEHQNQGIGTAVILALLDEARARQSPMRLQVFPNNPARRLYRRLGFCEESITDTHVHMIWRADRHDTT